MKDVNTTDFSGSFTWRTELAQAGSGLYFAFDDGIHGTELWRTDGTAGGTRMVKDICPGACSSSPTWLTAVGPYILSSPRTTEPMAGSSGGRLGRNRAPSCSGTACPGSRAAGRPMPSS
ncbi:MAG TPA: ELWxxDGT repeat protein [Thermoanaerobaculia bacterium]|nr:ELWxxDGT repeat protein [Thermoanaerobaculia bacterium]